MIEFEDKTPAPPLSIIDLIVGGMAIGVQLFGVAALLWSVIRTIWSSIT